METFQTQNFEGVQNFIMNKERMWILMVYILRRKNNNQAIDIPRSME